MSASRPTAYVDASGLAKLVMAEPETASLSRFLATYSMTVNDIGVTELLRAVLRWDEAMLPSARALLDRLTLVHMTTALLHEAGTLLPRTLRSLDAIHVASALALGGELDVLVTYDRRMREAAELAGLRVESPA